MQVEAASVSVTNMRREMQARERRAAELEAALGSLRDKSAATDAQLATSRQRVRELEVCPPVTHVSMYSKIDFLRSRMSCIRLGCLRAMRPPLQES